MLITDQNRAQRYVWSSSPDGGSGGEVVVYNIADLFRTRGHGVMFLLSPVTKTKILAYSTRAIYTRLVVINFDDWLLCCLYRVMVK